MTRTTAALLLAGALVTPALAEQPAEAPPPAPSILDPVKPLADAYARGLASCYGWPTAAGVWWCKVDQLIELWRRQR